MEVFHPTLQRQLKGFMVVVVVSQVALIGGSPLPIRTGYSPGDVPYQSSYLELGKNAPPPLYTDSASYHASMWGGNTDDKKDPTDNVELDLIQVTNDDYEQLRILAQWWSEYKPKSEYFAPTLKDGNWMPTPEELPENEAEMRLAVKAVSTDYPYGYL